MTTTVMTLHGACPLLQGQRWDLVRRARLGRLPTLEVALSDPSLSRVHAEIVPEPRGWVVYDLGSMNGTFVNGERLGRAGVLLRGHDILQLGDLLFTAVASGRDSAGTPPPPALTARASSLVCWDSLEQALAAEPPAWGQQLLFQLARFGRSASAHDSVEDDVRTLLWQAGEVVNAAHGVIALFSDATETGWQIQLAESFGGQCSPRVWSRPGLLKTASATRHSGLFELADPEPGESPLLLLALLRYEGQLHGVLGLARPAEAPPFTPRDLLAADAVALAASSSIHAVVQHGEQQKRLLLRTLTALTQLVQLRDDHTASHAQRVTDYALLLAHQLGLSDPDKHYLRLGTPLHDLGKIGVSDAVLVKSGPLNAAEVAAFRDHVLQAAELIEQIPSLSPLVPIVRNCRERWDGAGFPDRLNGSRIPLLARIVAVADAFDAMTTAQPYRDALPLVRAFAELRAGAGTQFDPACVEAFLQLGPELEESRRQRSQSTSTMSVAQLRAQLADLAVTGATRARGR